MDLVPGYKEALNRAAVDQQFAEATEMLMKRAEILQSYVNDYVL